MKHITAPLTQEGERCPWPWDPQQLVGAPMGQYHCIYCGEMVMAGLEHLDYPLGWEDEYEEMMRKYALDDMERDDYRGMDSE